MNIETIKDLNRWQGIVDSLPDFPGKIYYYPQYYKAFEANKDGRAVALYFQRDECQIFYPFLKMPIPESVGGKGFYDIQTAYGYGGPAIFNMTSEHIKDYLDEFASWCENEKIIAEFVRFNPLQSSHQVLKEFYHPELNRRTIVVDLNNGFDGILQQCTPARRRNYKKALRANLRFCDNLELSSFSKLYNQTMNRLKADKQYFFSQLSLTKLAELLSSQAMIAGIYSESNQLIAAGVFLSDKESTHYHLGAWDESTKDLQPSSFMMLEVAKSAMNSGKSLFHLGGGLSISTSDNLFRFKSGFSKNYNDFFIAKKIHQSNHYKKISQNWEQLTRLKPGILLHYHYGVQYDNL